VAAVLGPGDHSRKQKLSVDGPGGLILGGLILGGLSRKNCPPENFYPRIKVSAIALKIFVLP